MATPPFIMSLSTRNNATRQYITACEQPKESAQREVAAYMCLRADKQSRIGALPFIIDAAPPVKDRYQLSLYIPPDNDDERERIRRRPLLVTDRGLAVGALSENAEVLPTCRIIRMQPSGAPFITRVAFAFGFTGEKDVSNATQLRLLHYRPAQDAFYIERVAPERLLEEASFELFGMDNILYAPNIITQIHFIPRNGSDEAWDTSLIPMSLIEEPSLSNYGDEPMSVVRRRDIEKEITRSSEPTTCVARNPRQHIAVDDNSVFEATLAAVLFGLTAIMMFLVSQ